MEFLRRNWVDLLMALLIATVIAAVLFLLLSGGKLFAPRANNAISGTPTPVTTPVVPKPSATKPSATKPSSPEIPATQSSTTNSSKPVAKPSASTKVAVAKPAISSNSKPTNGKTNLQAINVPEIPAVDKAPKKPAVDKTLNKPTTAKKPAVSNTKKPQAAISKTSKLSTAQTQKTTNPNTIKPRATTSDISAPKPNAIRPNKATKPVQTTIKPTSKPTSKPISRSSYLSNYRIVVGSYKTQPRAETLAAQVRAQGFPARAVLSQGFYLVIVGPYARPNSAESAFGQLKGSYPGAVLYRPNGSRSSGTRETNPKKPAEGSSSKPATLNSKLAKQATTKTSMTLARPIPKLSTTSPSIQTAYLQVGSFRNAASASPLLIDLRKAGYLARLRVTNDGMTRVVIGPLTGTPLELARADLRSRGLQPFTIR